MNNDEIKSNTNSFSTSFTGIVIGLFFTLIGVFFSSKHEILYVKVEDSYKIYEYIPNFYDYLIFVGFFLMVFSSGFYVSKRYFDRKQETGG